VFGPRQDPDGAYAAVIPRFVARMLRRMPVTIYGDGDTTRDFCYVANVVQANSSRHRRRRRCVGQVYNVAVGERTSLNALHALVRELLLARHPRLSIGAPHYAAFRAGDVRHSEADLGKAQRLLGYRPAFDVRAGLAAALPWYEANAAACEPHDAAGVRDAV
jgi:UDP-N-acetylglucosamine 4-epimerase